MENKVVGYIPRLLFKIYLSLKERFDPSFPIPEEEKITVEICKKLISDPDSKLTFAPISNKRFIKNEKMGIYVIMEKYNVQVINHIYSYSITLGDKSWGKLIDFYNQEIEKRRNQFESEIRSNIKHSLKNILHDIEEKI